MDTGQTLVARNDRHRFIPASVTKVMTLFLAFELIDRGKLSPDQAITMRNATQAEWDRKGSTMFIRPGQSVRLDEMLAGIAAISANDAAVSLAEAAGGSIEGWTAMMNDEARKLGMRDSHFGTPNGWPDDGKTFTSARDLEVLARALIRRHPEEYKRYFGRDGLAFNGIAQANHDPITRQVRGADGIKTGFTNEAGHTFLGSAERGGTRLIMILAGIEDYEERGAVSRALIERGFSDFDRIALFRKGATIGTLKIQDGAIDRVALKASHDIRVAVPKGTKPKIELTVRYAGPVRAPISPDVSPAVLEVKIEGMEAVNFPLLPAQQVDQAGFFRRIGNGLKSWFA